ncbi:ABC transporter permease [Gemmatirosa kalamazoonensis]|nr:ABC transporter permease [Gemmatirosa kalamazoonensis]
MLERFDTLRGDVSFAVRQLRRTPVLSAAAILCFALGIGANSAIFSIVNGVLIRPLPYRDVDRVVAINDGLPKQGPGFLRGISAPELLDYRALDGRIFQATAIYEQRTFTVAAPDGALERAQGALVSGNFLRVLGREPALGRVPATWTANASDPTAASAASEVIVSHAFWQTHLRGDPDVVGKSMPFGNGVATVAAVMPPDVQFPIGAIGAEPAQVFALYALTPDVLKTRADRYGTWAFGRLADGVTVAQASAAVNSVASGLPQRYPDMYRGATERVLAEAAPLRETIVGPVRRPLLVLLAAVCLVLLIACLNVSSLLVARSVARQREIAVRRAIGASRSRLARQFLTESIVLVATGGALGLLLGHYGAVLLTRLDPNASLNGYDVGLDWRVVAATAAVTALTGIVFSVLPGLAGHDDFHTSLREREASARGAGTSRSGLVVAEIAIALLLTVGAGLMVRSFLHLRAVDPGFDVDQLLTFRVNFPESRYPTHDAAITSERLLADRLRAIPGVAAVGAATDIPLTEGSQIVFTPDPAVGPPPDKMPVVALSLVHPGYFEAAGIRLRLGRAFTVADDPGSVPVVIVSEAVAKRYYAGNAIGRQFKWGGPDSPQPWRTVVGIAGDVKQGGLADENPPLAVYIPAAQINTGPAAGQVRGTSYLVRTSGDPRRSINPVRSTVKDFDARMPVAGLRPMSDMLARSIADRKFNMFLLGAFAAVAVSLAAVGIYGLIAYSVAQRTRELGIRIALGAVPRDVLLLVVRQGASLALIGIVIGSLGAVAVTRWMRSMLFQIDPLDPITFGLVGLGLAAVAVGASWFPATRAANVGPVVAMRTD